MWRAPLLFRDSQALLAGCALAAAVVLSPIASAAQTSDEPAGAAVVGDETVHVVQPGDTMAALAARYGVDRAVLASENALKPTAVLTPGRTLRIVSRHIVPRGFSDGIVVNIPQRHLFYFRDGALVAHYPVAVGRRDWRTPTGEFHVAVKETDPTWEVPKSIQAEMRRTGKRVLTSVPPGPDNPLGRHWIGLNRTGVGIHGTNAPGSIHKTTTHGCIRMHPDDIEELFAQVELDTRVTIIYEPVLVAQVDGATFVEAHADVYGVYGALRNALPLAEASSPAISRILARREGIARPVAALSR